MNNLDEKILEIGRRHFPSNYFVDIARKLYQETGEAYISLLEEPNGAKKRVRLWSSLPCMDRNTGHVDWGPHGVIECFEKFEPSWELEKLLMDCEEITRDYYGREGTQAIIYHIKR